MPDFGIFTENVLGFMSKLAMIYASISGCSNRIVLMVSVREALKVSFVSSELNVEYALSAINAE
jgi:hypothetical protein